VEKLSFLDAAFLRMESPERPFHVAGLMILKLPEKAPPNYLRRLARQTGRLNELWPIFNRKLADPHSVRNPGWVPADDYDPDYHVHHYALAVPGRMDDLLNLVSRVHERVMDRSRPLWEIHIIEGLQGGRFALYCKTHHALVDGVGALRMVNALFRTDPDAKINMRTARPIAQEHHEKLSLAKQLAGTRKELMKHYAALPQVGSLLAGMGLDALLGKKDVPPLPFTAPRTLFNGEVDARRQIIIAELPLKGMRTLATPFGGTLNDTLVAVCGGAMRAYLQGQDSLPGKSMEAGLPVSIKRAGQSDGNQVSMIICQMFTNEADPLKRLQRVIRVSSKAKADLRKMSSTAAQDVSNMLFVPALVLTLSGNATRVAPAFNAIISNVPGSPETLYLEGSELEAIYPFSIVTDSMGINITVISYRSKLCIAVTSCPTEQPGIAEFGKLIRQSYRELAAAARQA
jgi:WS/DGAT/MGAT family acyltransferase